MQYKTHKSFASLLAGTPELRNFTAKLDHLNQMNQVISSKLEPSLASHCHVANLRDGTLILATTSPAWNHKLRFSALDLLSTLRADPRWSGLKSIEIRVDYLPNTETASTMKRSKPITLSAASAQLIKQAADNISNPSLAEAMRRLALRDRR